MKKIVLFWVLALFPFYVSPKITTQAVNKLVGDALRASRKGSVSQVRTILGQIPDTYKNQKKLVRQFLTTAQNVAKSSAAQKPLPPKQPGPPSPAPPPADTHLQRALQLSKQTAQTEETARKAGQAAQQAEQAELDRALALSLAEGQQPTLPGLTPDIIQQITYFHDQLVSLMDGQDQFIGFLTRLSPLQRNQLQTYILSAQQQGPGYGNRYHSWTRLYDAIGRHIRATGVR